MTLSRSRFACAVIACGLTAPATASIAIFEHGNGIKSMGFGGVGYSNAEETTAIAANPAHTSSLAGRFDLGVDLLIPQAEARYRGNQAGPDETFDNDGRTYFFIPQGGVTRALDSKWSIGLSALGAGLGPDYERSPYARFGGYRRARLAYSQVGLVGAVSYRIDPAHAVAVSVNPGYQEISLLGLEPFRAVSASPQHVTGQGRDGSFTLGYTLGWVGTFGQRLTAGASYRSKTWAQKHDEYRGVLPDAGRLELPAIWGLGLAVKPLSAWTLAFDYQRYEFEDEPTFRNTIEQLYAGELAGSKHGPGFGFKDINAYKFGLAWQAQPRLRLRAGYIETSQANRPVNTLFDFIGPISATQHYTAGASYQFARWELSGYTHVSPRGAVQGRNSIPPAFGGGEADLNYRNYGVGLSVGRTLGNTQ